VLHRATPGELHDTVDLVARRLIGAQLRRGGVHLEITEVEAYAGPEDSASHARFGPTERNAPMWGRAGLLYVYLCYGVHNLVNVSCGPEGQASAVLIRSVLVRRGAQLVQTRRGGKALDELICAGPGKVGQALALDRHASGEDLCAPRGTELWLSSGAPPLLHGPRVGIDFADARDRKRRWRFAAADTGAISKPGALQKLR
jgi:DNA-3-methyladenine glycosylase